MKYRQFTKSELEWIKKFQSVMKDAPKELFMFVGSGTIIVYSEHKHNSFGCVDQEVPNFNISTKMICDGGDW